jgi:uncharacterized membrane protein
MLDSWIDTLKFIVNRFLFLEGLWPVLLRFLYLLSLSLWIGSMTFFSFMVAPSIFHTLPREEAGKVVAAIFPKYYWQGAICGIVALAVSIVLGTRTRWSNLLLLRVILLSLMLLGVLYSVVILEPRIHAVKAQVSSWESVQPTDPLRIEFGRLHARSFGVNAAVLLLGLIVLFLTAFTMKV